MPHDPSHVHDHAADYRSGAVGAWVGILGNVALGAGKLAAGVFGRSAAMVADAAHSLSDAVSSIAVLVGFRVARRPVDADHPWGHGKAESIAAKIVALLLLGIGLVIGWNAVEGIARSAAGEVREAPGFIALVAAAVSILVKEGMYQYKSRIARRIGSTSLAADAWHHRSDALSSVVALAGIAAARAGGPAWHVFDHVAALGVAAIILWIGAGAFRQASRELMDEMIPAAAIAEIRRVALSVEGVRDVEKLEARKSGLDVIVNIHVEVDGDLPVREGHEIAGRVRDELMGHIRNVERVVVHIEPYCGTPHAPPAGGDSPAA